MGSCDPTLPGATVWPQPLDLNGSGPVRSRDCPTHSVFGPATPVAKTLGVVWRGMGSVFTRTTSAITSRPFPNFVLEKAQDEPRLPRFAQDEHRFPS